MADQKIGCQIWDEVSDYDKNPWYRKLIQKANEGEKTMLFEIVVVEMPTKEDADKGKLEKIVVPITPIVAKDVDAAKRKAIKLIPEGVDLDRAEVKVRNFA